MKDYAGGDFKTCQDFDGVSGDVSVGAEVFGTTATQRVDVHDDNIERSRIVSGTLTWVSLSSGERPASRSDVATRALETLGTHAGVVQVGATRVVMNHGDPIEGEVRPHDAWWTDGEWDYSLMGAVPAGELIAMAVSIIC